MDIEFEFNYNSEIRMGTDGWGLVIKKDDVIIDVLKKEFVFIGVEPKADKPFIVKSTDRRYYIIKGYFFTYIFDTEQNAFSLYKATVRSEDGIWCQETPVWGKDAYHLNGEDGEHYYLQFPFIPHTMFKKRWEQYSKKRLDQIKLMKADI
jgi:hypothetical protein